MLALLASSAFAAWEASGEGAQRAAPRRELCPPSTPPPQVRGTSVSAPSAWVDARLRCFWLAYGSFCWRTGCVDFVPPARRSDLLTLLVPRGERVRVHLRFRPSSVAVLVGKIRVAAATAPVVAWRAGESGLLRVEARGRHGSVSYLARIRVLAP